MIVAYVAGRYAGNTPGNVNDAVVVGKELALLGFAPLVPHAIGWLVEKEGTVVVQDRAFWLAATLAMARKADILVMMPRWWESEGSCREHQDALERRAPIYYWPQNAEQLRKFAEGAK